MTGPALPWDDHVQRRWQFEVAYRARVHDASAAVADWPADVELRQMVGCIDDQQWYENRQWEERSGVMEGVPAPVARLGNLNLSISDGCSVDIDRLRRCLQLRTSTIHTGDVRAMIDARAAYVIASTRYLLRSDPLRSPGADPVIGGLPAPAVIMSDPYAPAYEVARQTMMSPRALWEAADSALRDLTEKELRCRELGVDFSVLDERRMENLVVARRAERARSVIDALGASATALVQRLDGRPGKGDARSKADAGRTADARRTVDGCPIAVLAEGVILGTSDSEARYVLMGERQDGARDEIYVEVTPVRETIRGDRERSPIELWDVWQELDAATNHRGEVVGTSGAVLRVPGLGELSIWAVAPDLGGATVDGLDREVLPMWRLQEAAGLHPSTGRVPPSKRNSGDRGI
jgi:hypothetical protein